MKQGIVYKKNIAAGIVWENETGYHFQYNATYLQNPQHGAVSRTLPLRAEAFTSQTMLPFFDGLIPEGWLLEIALENWKLDRRDRMALLLTLCEDCIGDVSVKKTKRR
jgi:serine/threonine-protein kinase HipA